MKKVVKIISMKDDPTAKHYIDPITKVLVFYNQNSAFVFWERVGNNKRILSDRTPIFNNPQGAFEAFHKTEPNIYKTIYIYQTVWGEWGSGIKIVSKKGTTHNVLNHSRKKTTKKFKSSEELTFSNAPTTISVGMQDVLSRSDLPIVRYKWNKTQLFSSVMTYFFQANHQEQADILLRGYYILQEERKEEVKLVPVVEEELL